jgi:hypothetical protein
MPAASAIASAPATLVVFLVAKAGKPTSSAACGCCFRTTIFGAGAGCSDSPPSESARRYAPTPIAVAAASSPTPTARRRLQYTDSTD